MNRRSLSYITLAAILGGIMLSVLYVNPYSGVINLSELVLQLSGSRGSFALGFSLLELVDFNIRLVPSLIVEQYLCLSFYHHFCTASVYVFSRCPKRTKWYVKECLSLWGGVCLFESMELISVLIVALIRYQVLWDTAGVALLLYHFVLFSLWLFLMSMGINLLAIYCGSGSAFASVAVIQVFFVTLLGCEDMAERYWNINIQPEGALLNWNPAAHLVLGWQHSSLEKIDQALHSPYETMGLNDSVLIYFCICLVIFVLGAAIVNRHDLLLSDVEMG